MKLSVLICTYNHEKFIAQALDSVLRQDVDFDFEIVVGEDCSKDGTRDILGHYQQKYPDRIRVLLRERNLGMHGNFAETFRNCRGEYIALLDGDDYWTSADKLRKQVKFLDAHRDYVAYFHNVTLLYEDNADASHPMYRRKRKSTFTLDDVVSGSCGPATSSTVFRNNGYDGFPDWFYGLYFTDLPLHILNAEHGDYYYDDAILANYRIHSGGVSLPQREALLKEALRIMEIVDAYLGRRFKKSVNSGIAGIQGALARYYFKNGQLKNGTYHLYQSITASFPTFVARLLRLISGIRP